MNNNEQVMIQFFYWQQRIEGLDRNTYTYTYTNSDTHLYTCIHARMHNFSKQKTKNSVYRSLLSSSIFRKLESRGNSKNSCRTKKIKTKKSSFRRVVGTRSAQYERPISRPHCDVRWAVDSLRRSAHRRRNSTKRSSYWLPGGPYIVWYIDVISFWIRMIQESVVFRCSYANAWITRSFM